MPTEMGAEAVEIITMAVDKFQAKKNYEVRVLGRLLANIQTKLKSCLSSKDTELIIFRRQLNSSKTRWTKSLVQHGIVQ